MKEYLKDYDENKIKKMLEVKEKYRLGEVTLEEGRAELRKHMDYITAEEIAIAEQELVEFEEDQCQKEDVQGMVYLFQELMVRGRPDLPDDHPIMCYYCELDELEKIILSIEDLVQYPMIKNQWYEIYDKLEEYKIHLSRKQNQLYSVLEQKGFDRPTTTMWTLDNFVRDEINEARRLLDEDKEAEFMDMQSTIVADLRDLNEKEAEILYPTSLQMISPEEFEDMKSGDREIGFAWITVDEKDLVKRHEAKAEVDSTDSFKADLSKLLKKHGMHVGTDTELDVATGKLTLEQINLIYKHMPVDISYVDENEIVKFYTDTDHRVFPRSKNVIGRDVKNCHPRSSVHIVEEIVEKFRSGEQDTAEFWINKPDLFIYIYYVAVRDEEGNFRGVMEMMQDCTHIRSLEGSRTLLTWGNEEGLEEVKEDKTEPSLEVEEDDVGKAKITKENLTPDTKLSDILKSYPELKGELPNINPKFKQLSSPLGRIMLKKATVKLMSEQSEMDLDELMEEIKKRID